MSPLARAVGGVAALAFVAAALGIAVPATPREQVAVDEPQYLMTARSIGADGDLDIANQLQQGDWRRFTAIKPPVETLVRPDGTQISPHDPLLPVLLAVPTVIGGWIGAKLALALLAAALAAVTLWVAVRRFDVPLRLATAGVALASASAPIAVYGQQVYPEIPAALACVVAVAALTGRPGRGWLVVLGLAVVALPWLALKYVPVAVALAGLGLVRWWRAGAGRDAVAFGAALALAGGLYLLTHLVVWGGWTPYASGDHFQDIGQLGVMGTNPNFLFRSWRLIDLLVDRTFGLVVWQPAWLLPVPAIAALAARRRGRALAVLGVPLLAGWLVATYVALTMHGHWWPGRQVVVVLPLAVLIVLVWLARAGRSRTVLTVLAGGLGLVGVFTYACLLVDGLSGELAWVNHFFTPDAPGYALLHPLLASYGTTTSNAVWAGLLTALATATYVGTRRSGRTGRAQPDSGQGKNEAVPATVRPTSSSASRRWCPSVRAIIRDESRTDSSTRASWP